MAESSYFGDWESERRDDLYDGNGMGGVTEYRRIGGKIHLGANVEQETGGVGSQGNDEVLGGVSAGRRIGQLQIAATVAVGLTGVGLLSAAYCNAFRNPSELADNALAAGIPVSKQFTPTVLTLGIGGAPIRYIGKEALERPGQKLNSDCSYAVGYSNDSRGADPDYVPTDERRLSGGGMAVRGPAPDHDRRWTRFSPLAMQVAASDMGCYTAEAGSKEIVATGDAATVLAAVKRAEYLPQGLVEVVEDPDGNQHVVVEGLGRCTLRFFLSSEYKPTTPSGIIPAHKNNQLNAVIVGANGAKIGEVIANVPNDNNDSVRYVAADGTPVFEDSVTTSELVDALGTVDCS